ncbi:MAG TPA: UPF0175 family protein [Phycisphaerae bacterium]|nr:UPF0175 family protein [Phycisphaerae bacterium]
MNVTVRVPDDIASRIGDGKDIPRQLLEAFAADAYRGGRLTRNEVGTLLGLDYWQTEEFLSARDAKRPYSMHDLEQDRQSLSGLSER